MYPNGRTIPKETKKAMMSLLKYLPPIKHNFYGTLPTTDWDKNLDIYNPEEDDIYYDD